MSGGSASRVVQLELNGVRLHVPEPWIWPNKAIWKSPSGDFTNPDPPLRPDDPSGVVHRISPQGMTLFLAAYEDRNRFFQLPADFWVFRIDFSPGPRDLASLPRRSIEDLPPGIKTNLSPPDEQGFRRLGRGATFYGVYPDDIGPSGYPVAFYCSSPFDPAPKWCSVDRP